MIRAGARLVLLLALVGGHGCLRSPSPDVPDLGPVGAFSLTERGGKTITEADLRGKVWIASFVFTRCTGPCPQVTATMARLQSELGKEPGLRLVTFTVDPGHDNPKELTEYAEHVQADPERWLFLTGEEAAIDRLLIKGFKVPVDRGGKELGHSPRLVLVDRQGHIRGYFDGIRETLSDDPEREFEANLKRLRTSVAVLLRESNR